MPEQEITVKVNIPEGYEATGEVRAPDMSVDYWLDSHGRVRGGRRIYACGSFR